MIYVLDAGPMIAFLNGDSGDGVVERLLTESPHGCFAHVFNLTEVYCIYYRRGGKAAAESAIQAILNLGIVPREDADMEYWKDAATFKAIRV